MRPLELNPETARLLERIRCRMFFLPAYKQKQSVAWAIAWRAIRPILSNAGLTEPGRNHYKAFARELTRRCRSTQGEELVLEIKLTLRKWRDFDLDFGLLQGLTIACCEAFAAFSPGLQPVTTRRPNRKGKRRPKRTYARAMADGDVPCGAEELKENQISAYEKAMKHNRAISRRVRQVLIDREIPLRQFIRYNAFAYRLDHAARNYTLKTLRMEAENIVDQWEVKGLNRPTLLAICRQVFDISTPF